MDKSETHKGMKDKQNFIVEFYYNNHLFFAMIVVCAELSTMAICIFHHEPAWFEIFAIKFFGLFLLSNLIIKMFINYHQWSGAAKRYKEFDQNT